MTNDQLSRTPHETLLAHVENAEKLFLAGRRPREADLESAPAGAEGGDVETFTPAGRRAILGLLVGSRMHFQVKEVTFHRAVGGVLLVSGLLLLVKR